MGLKVLQFRSSDGSLGDAFLVPEKKIDKASLELLEKAAAHLDSTIEVTDVELRDSITALKDICEEVMGDHMEEWCFFHGSIKAQPCPQCQKEKAIDE
jgi:hypothetical protein